MSEAMSLSSLHTGLVRLTGPNVGELNGRPRPQLPYPSKKFAVFNVQCFIKIIGHSSTTYQNFTTLIVEAGSSSATPSSK